jgi:hypothetical protein
MLKRLVVVKQAAVIPLAAAIVHWSVLAWHQHLAASSIPRAVSLENDSGEVHKVQCCVKAMSSKVHHQSQSVSFEVELSLESLVLDGLLIHLSLSMMSSDSTSYDANHVEHVVSEGTCPHGLTIASEQNSKSLATVSDIVMMTGCSVLVIYGADHGRIRCLDALYKEIVNQEVSRDDNASQARCLFQVCLVQALVAALIHRSLEQNFHYRDFHPATLPIPAFAAVKAIDLHCSESSVVNQLPTACRLHHH